MPKTTSAPGRPPAFRTVIVSLTWPVEWVPDLAEEATTEAVQVDDGEYLLLAARLAPEKAAAPGKERAVVLLVRPLIYIEEEEWFKNKKGD